MSYTLAPTNAPRPEAPIYATVEQALLAAFAQQHEQPTVGVLVIYDHLDGTPLLLVWQERAYWP